MENRELITFIRDIVLIITGVTVFTSSLLILFLIFKIFKDINKTIAALSRTANRLDKISNKIIDDITFPVFKITNGFQKLRSMIKNFTKDKQKETKEEK
ncbi:MAG: hypothetical protein CL764_03515 [Chloroflexi bacterium]|nr:hypothetical protein [Chloroflexota bacterium]|tara:strand:- start:83 stop:379 length:297 start_codon:yes stop_codon:yes gene_type:complete